jgi:hypothetical protein
MKKTLLTALALVSMGAAAYAVETETWKHSSQDDFLKGTMEKLSLRSDGRLLLAPKIEELLDSSAAALWSVVEDSKGNVYVGGGGPGSGSAKLFRVEASGSHEVIAELEALEIQAIAVNGSDEVFAATAPDGEVFKIAAGGAEVFYNPEAKYIWAMVFDEAGNLYLGTGDGGEVHKVAPDGIGSVFFETEETHVRSLTMDANGNLIAGTEPNGLILRVSPAGDGFVVHQADKKEVTTVAVAPDGSIYAAAIGTKKPALTIPRPVTPVAPRPTTAAAGTAQPHGTTGTTSQAGRPPVTPLPRMRTAATGGSDIYKIEADGYPRLVWSDKQALVYGIVIDKQGRPVFGTGNEGRIYRLESDHLHTLLLETSSSQVTALHSSDSGRLFAATSNIGKLFGIGPDLESKGSYEGEVLDADFFSYWGRIGFRGETADGTISLETRSGNLDRPQLNWSPWKAVEVESQDGRVSAPAARFLQYKVTLAASAAGKSPAVSSIDAAYLHKNVAPVIRKVVATPPNYRFAPQTLTLTRSKNINLPSLSATRRPSPVKPATTTRSQSMQSMKGHVGVRWLAEDDNKDELRYRVEIRGESESEWKLLEEDLKLARTSWDSTAFADGEYRVKVTASDQPSNPPLQALSAEMESEPFLIDNTPPVVTGLSAAMSGGRLTASWGASDANTVISKAEYSLDGGEWTVAEPTTRLSDSKALQYEVRLEDVGSGEHTVAVRVADSFDNQTVVKVVVR